MSILDLSATEQLQIAQKLRAQYIDRLPVIFVPEKNLKIQKEKFLAKKETTFAELIGIVRKYISVRSSEAIYCIVNKTLPPNSKSVAEIYNECNVNGLLVVHIRKESTFG